MYFKCFFITELSTASKSRNSTFRDFKKCVFICSCVHVNGLELIIDSQSQWVGDNSLEVNRLKQNLLTPEYIFDGSNQSLPPKTPPDNCLRIKFASSSFGSTVIDCYFLNFRECICSTHKMFAIIAVPS